MTVGTGNCPFQLSGYTELDCSENGFHTNEIVRFLGYILNNFHTIAFSVIRQKGDASRIHIIPPGISFYMKSCESSTNTAEHKGFFVAGGEIKKNGNSIKITVLICVRNCKTIQ